MTLYVIMFKTEAHSAYMSRKDAKDAIHGDINYAEYKIVKFVEHKK